MSPVDLNTGCGKVAKKTRRKKVSEASSAKVSNKKVTKAHVPEVDSECVQNNANCYQNENVNLENEESDFLIKVNGTFVQAKKDVKYVCLDGDDSFHIDES